jgi:hypothetical protein
LTTSKGSPFAKSASAQCRMLLRSPRSSATSSKLPPLDVASLRSCAVAASALAKSRAAPTTGAPCAARDRAVSTPRPAEAPVIKIRFPFRLMPDRTLGGQLKTGQQGSLQNRPTGVGPGRGPYLPCFVLIRQVCFGSPAPRSAFQDVSVVE